jgi:hypothetical protein
VEEVVATGAVFASSTLKEGDAVVELEIFCASGPLAGLD